MVACGYIIKLGDRLSRNLLLNLILIIHIFELIALTIPRISNSVWRLIHIHSLTSLTLPYTVRVTASNHHLKKDQ